MYVKQLSVFLENRPGRLKEAVKVLCENGINIVAMSLADTSEFGLFRLIVSDPDKANELLRNNGYSAVISDVLAVEMTHEVGALYKVLEILAGEGINVEYLYLMVSSSEQGAMIIKTSQQDKAIKILTDAGITLYEASKAYSLGMK